MLQVRDAVGNEAAVLGFAGAPFTLASYIVEGGSSKNYSNLKKLAFSEPEVLHALLGKLADNVTDYMRYQADHGAQVCSCPHSRCLLASVSLSDGLCSVGFCIGFLLMLRKTSWNVSSMDMMYLANGVLPVPCAMQPQ